ncbi:hypothetical protein M9H77_30509 [Catharanthus roseus]|uniref:Uncharacterized protein n=1 Tax=Catharanthus roseus TaxID=4058 RepID=A0ACB9ZXH0_CATRO|nr:hypothetical protein M9H77_30509 [Catharanthus roseus]
MPSQRFVNVEIMKPSMIEEFSKVNELPQATIEVEECVVLHVKEEISNVEHCDVMGDTNLEKDNIEIKEKERVENKERLVERSCIFDSISILSKESEHFECSKEKESGLEKSEKVKENECFIEKQESEKEEQREKEIVALEKSEEMNFYANETNSFFSRIEDKGRNMEKELGAIFKELPINLSLNPSLMCYEVSFVHLKLFLESYLSHVSIIEDTCTISFGVGLFLVGGEPSCFGCELVHDDSFFDAKASGFLEFNCASFVVFNEKFKEKCVDNWDSTLSFFETFMNGFYGAIFLNLYFLFLSNK